MNKVVSINLNGFIFSIDEQAYGLLRQYIDRLHKHFAGTEGAAEIISDIETRMAELLQQQLDGQNQVVQLMQVQRVIAMMGEPWEIDGQSSAENNAENSTSSARPVMPEGAKKLRRDPSRKVLGGVCSGTANYLGIDPVILRAVFAISFFVFGTGLLLYIILWIALPVAKPGEMPEAGPVKRMFRDPERRIAGGVCGGLGSYFGIDPVWFRIAFLVALFFFGSGVLLYIILWISIPKARTAAEKLQMKGEPVDVNNIERVVRSSFPRASEPVNRAGSMLTEILKSVLKLFVRLVGFVFLVLAVCGTIFLGVALAGNYSPDWSILMRVFLGDGSLVLLLQLGVLLITVSLITVFALAGIKLLFQATLRTKLINVIMAILFLGGCALLGIGATRYVQEVYAEENVVERVAKTVAPDTIYIRSSEKWKDAQRGTRVVFHRFRKAKAVNMTHIEGEGLFMTTNSLVITASRDDSLSLQLNKHCNGSSDEEAANMARAINYQALFDGSSVVLDPGVLIGDQEMFKFQRVTVRMRVPVGTIIKMDKEAVAMLNRAENRSRSREFDLGETFKMTDQGLRCLDCDDEDPDEMEVEEGVSIHIGDDDGEKIRIRVDENEEGVVEEKVIIEDGKTTRTRVHKKGPVKIITTEENEQKTEEE